MTTGIYKLSEKNSEGFSCKFEKVHFGVISVGENMYRYINKRYNIKATSQKVFVDRYWEKHFSRKADVFRREVSLGEPLTFCSLDPSLEYTMIDYSN